MTFDGIRYGHRDQKNAFALVCLFYRAPLSPDKFRAMTIHQGRSQISPPVDKSKRCVSSSAMGE
jgi:hypothetical protein